MEYYNYIEYYHLFSITIEGFRVKHNIINVLELTNIKIVFQLYEIIKLFNFSFLGNTSFHNENQNFNENLNLNLNLNLNINTESYELSSDNDIKAKYFKKAYIEYMLPCFRHIEKSIQYMKQQPNHQQRSKEWYDARNEKISASSIYKVLDSKKSDYKNIKFEKLGVQLKPFSQSKPIMHGVMFEQISQVLYETRNNVKIIEFGCIPHPKYDFIGASPDGVVYLPNILDNHQNQKYTLEQLCLHGRLIEIKNPYSQLLFICISFFFL